MDKKMEISLNKAKVLVEALPYIQKFNRKIIVIKYGGSAMTDESLMDTVIEDVTLLKLVGFKPVIVHGGGKDISKWVEASGKKPEFVNGLRVTDKETMEIAEMVLGAVGKRLVGKVEKLGVHAVSISGRDGGLLKAKKKLSGGQDIGFVGEIAQVNAKVVFDLLEKDFLPIICPIAMDDNFVPYNINADDAACAIAKAVSAEKLTFLTDTEGVYRDFEDKTSLIRCLTVKDAVEFMEKGYAQGGMLPKLSGCVDAVKNGVNRVHILDGRMPHSLLLEIFTNDGAGTMVVPDEA